MNSGNIIKHHFSALFVFDFQHIENEIKIKFMNRKQQTERKVKRRKRKIEVSVLSGCSNIGFPITSAIFNQHSTLVLIYFSLFFFFFIFVTVARTYTIKNPRYTT